MKKKKAMLDLRSNKIFFLSIISFLLFVNCKNTKAKETENHHNRVVDTLVFKSWIKDTVTLFKENGTKFKVYQDSTLLEIYKSYDTILDEKTKIDNKDLALAFELLKENNDLNLENIKVDFEVIHSYEVSQVGNKFDYSFEIKKFQASSSGITYQYNYLKGNLIEKKHLK